VPEFITNFFMDEKYQPYVIGGAAVGAVITITIMMIILIRAFRDK
jgi:hypothetical protein